MSNPTILAERLMAYLKGELSGEELREIEERLSKDAELRQLVDDIRDKAYITREISKLQSFDVEKAWKNVASHDEKKANLSTPIAHHPSHFYRIAAAIALLIVGGALVWYMQYTKVTPPEISPEVLAAMQQSQQSGHVGANIENGGTKSETQGVRDAHQTEKDDEGNVTTHSPIPAAQDQFLLPPSISTEELLHAKRITTFHDKEFWLTLDDGTLVHLNYNTRVIYPEKFGRKTREVILDGEAYFMVAKDRSRPFIVHTPQGDVKVYGTEFYISTKADDTNNSSTTITLIKGSVGVTPSGGTEQRMLPGQQCSIINAQCSISATDIEPYVAWNQGVFVFEDCTLERLMNVLSQWYGYQVVFKDDKARRALFTGELDKYSSFRPVLEAISSVTDINFTIKENTIIIHK